MKLIFNQFGTPLVVFDDPSQLECRPSMPAAPTEPSRRPAAQPAATVEAPPLAPTAAPLCYIVDEDASIRHFLSLVLHGVGIDSVEFADSAALRQAAADRLPDLILLNISLDSADAFEAMAELGARSFRGAVQLTSSRGARGARARQEHRHPA